MRQLLLAAALLAGGCLGAPAGEPCVDDSECSSGTCSGRRCERDPCSCGDSGCDAPSEDCPDGWLCKYFDDILTSGSRQCVQACPCPEPFVCWGNFCMYQGPTVEIDAPEEIARGQEVTLRALPTSPAPVVEVTWTLGDQLSAAGNEVIYAWPQEGEYPISVAILDEDGGKASGYASIAVCIPDGAGPCDDGSRCCGSLFCDPTTRRCHK